jgi:DNA-binding transcriptional MerR regulator
MFRIGDFSRIARVSARLLRFYDEINLFSPAHADPQTGYRYYSIAQPAQLNRILVLKELGFNLDQVRDVLSANVGAAELRNILLLRRNDVARTLEVVSRRLHSIETRIAQLESEDLLALDDVIVRAEPSHPFLALRRKVTSFGAARGLIAELRAHARPLLPKGCPSTLIAVAHSPQFDQEELDVEFGYALDDAMHIGVPQGSPLTLRELEGVARMAVCIRVGLPEDAHLVTAKIGRFVETGGDRLAGPSREVFLQPPDPDRMHEAVVEMQFPIEACAAADAGPQAG